MKANGWLPLVVLLAVAIAITACDPGHEITFNNETSTTVTIYFEGRPQASVNASEAKAYVHLEYSGAGVWEAKDAQGNVVYQAKLTWADLRTKGWTITIH